MLYGNPLESLPPELFTLSRLHTLRLSAREFAETAHLDAHTEQLIARNQLHSVHIPNVIFELPALRALDLTGAPLASSSSLPSPSPSPGRRSCGCGSLCHLLICDSVRYGKHRGEAEHVAGVHHAVARAPLFAAQLLPLVALQHVSALEPHVPRRLDQPPQPRHRRHPQPPKPEGLAACTALTDSVFLFSPSSLLLFLLVPCSYRTYSTFLRVQYSTTCTPLHARSIWI